MSWYRGGSEGPVQLWQVGLVHPGDVPVVGHPHLLGRVREVFSRDLSQSCKRNNFLENLKLVKQTG